MSMTLGRKNLSMREDEHTNAYKCFKHLSVDDSARPQKGLVDDFSFSKGNFQVSAVSLSGVDALARYS